MAKAIWVLWSLMIYRFMAPATTCFSRILWKQPLRVNFAYSHGVIQDMVRTFSFSHNNTIQLGMNKVCFTHVDNYAHALILAERALYPGSKALGKFYIVTDGKTHPQTEVNYFNSFQALNLVRVSRISG